LSSGKKCSNSSCPHRGRYKNEQEKGKSNRVEGGKRSWGENGKKKGQSGDLNSNGI